MFTGLSPHSRVRIRTTLAAGWLLTAGAGMVTLFVVPQFIEENLGNPLRFFWSVALGVSGLVAALGVLTNRYRWEWAASWFSAASSVPYVVTLWVLVLSGTYGAVAGAFYGSALIAFMMSRAYLCAAHAEKLRAANTGQVPNVPTGE